MELILIYLGTIIGSVAIKVKNIYDIYKDTADLGYKFNFDKIKSISIDDNINNSKSFRFATLIPIYNLYKVLKERLDYKINIKPNLLNALEDMNIIEEFSETEALEYLSNPTGLNAMLVPIRFQRRLENASSLIFKTHDYEGTIYFEIREDIDDFIVLKATGDISKLDIEEQKDLVVDYYEKLVLSGIKKYGSVDNFLNEIQHNPSIDLNNFEQANDDIIDDFNLEDKEKGPTLKRKR